MIMKLAATTLLIAVALFCYTAASAGSIEVGYVDDAGLDRWLAGGPAKVPTGETVCKPAKFDESSRCGNIVISNHSSQAITVSFTPGSEEFWTGLPGAFGAFVVGHERLPCSFTNVHGFLRPGESCFQRVDFWPWNGDAYHGTIHVVVKSGDSSTGTDFKFIGTSHYPPELQAAEEVRQRHEAELKKISHVETVELDDQDGIKIDVTVTEEDEIEDVRRQVLPKIEGYDTEVTQHVGHAYFD
jgi:hypothetical protein